VTAGNCREYFCQERDYRELPRILLPRKELPGTAENISAKKETAGNCQEYFCQEKDYRELPRILLPRKELPGTAENISAEKVTTRNLPRRIYAAKSD
jgi:hypothetical protein